MLIINKGKERDGLSYKLSHRGIMENDWKNIWNNKTANLKEKNTEFEVFSELKRADGFDVAVENEEIYYRSFYDEWIAFYELINKFATTPIESVYEVGCGSGVNLYMFRNRGIKRVGGIDYSASLIMNAKKIIDSRDIVVGEAINIPEKPQYDLVMSESVFQYFSNLEYASTVLKRMLSKSNGIVYLGEIHDSKYENELIGYRRRTIKNYDMIYKGLSKQFYSKEWIENIAGNRKVIFTEVNNSEYLNGKYLFNCFILPNER